jgi:hypothetical protein
MEYAMMYLYFAWHFGVAVREEEVGGDFNFAPTLAIGGNTISRICSGLM